MKRQRGVTYLEDGPKPLKIRRVSPSYKYSDASPKRVNISLLYDGQNIIKTRGSSTLTYINTIEETTIALKDDVIKGKTTTSICETETENPLTKQELLTLRYGKERAFFDVMTNEGIWIELRTIIRREYLEKKCFSNYDNYKKGDCAVFYNYRGLLKERVKHMDFTVESIKIVTQSNDIEILKLLFENKKCRLTKEMVKLSIKKGNLSIIEWIYRETVNPLNNFGIKGILSDIDDDILDHDLLSFIYSLYRVSTECELREKYFKILIWFISNITFFPFIVIRTLQAMAIEDDIKNTIIAYNIVMKKYFNLIDGDFNRVVKYPFNPNFIQMLAKNNRLDVLKWIDDIYGVRIKEEYSIIAYDEAAKGGHFKTLKWLMLKKYSKCSDDIITDVVSINRLDIIRYLHNKGYKVTEKAVYISANNNLKSITEYFSNLRIKKQTVLLSTVKKSKRQQSGGYDEYIYDLPEPPMKKQKLQKNLEQEAYEKIKSGDY